MLHAVAASPLWLSVVVVILAPTLVAALLPILVRQRIPYESLAANNEVAGVKFGVMGVVYAVLLAFTAIAVWEEFRDAENGVAQETGALITLDRMAAGLPEPMRQAVRERIIAYADKVTLQEWPRMATGRGDPAARDALAAINILYLDVEPASQREAILLRTGIDLLVQVSEIRRKRISWSRGTVPDILLAVLLAGAAIVLGFPMFLGARNVRVQAAMTAALGLVITMILLVTLELNYPFTGPMAIGPGDFRCLLRPACS